MIQIKATLDGCQGDEIGGGVKVQPKHTLKLF